MSNPAIIPDNQTITINPFADMLVTFAPQNADGSGPFDCTGWDQGTPAFTVAPFGANSKFSTLQVNVNTVLFANEGGIRIQVDNNSWATLFNDIGVLQNIVGYYYAQNSGGARACLWSGLIALGGNSASYANWLP